jgi:hypothetical protein
MKILDDIVADVFGTKNKIATWTRSYHTRFTHICKIFLQIGMCKISYKFVKNESYQFLSILQKIGTKLLQKYLSY